MTARIAGAAALLLCALIPVLRSSPAPAGAFDEVDRIRHHLAAVETTLRSTDAGHLDAGTRAARSRLLDILGQYRRQGVFPHNHVVSDRRTTVFIDEHGTHCAVGYLMARTGEGDLARRIADTANLARVADLAADPEFREWLDRNGLTAYEAAMIQPTYGGQPSFQQDEAYDAATVIMSVVDLPLIILNRPGRESGGIAAGLGLAIGALQTTLGTLGYFGDQGDIRDLSIGANLVLGAAGIGFGLHQLLRARDDRSTSSENRDPGPSLHLSPWLSREGASGFRLGLRW